MSTVFRVEKNANYTVMANYHLKDRRLSYKAKGLLSEMLSLPPDWDYTLAGLAYISADGIDSVRSAVRELESCGYLVRFQRRDERGRMSVNEYLVYENPEQNPDYTPAEDEGKSSADNKAAECKNGSVKASAPSLENPITVGKSDEKQKILANSLSAKSLPTIPLSENPTTATFNILNTQLLNIQKSNHSINRAARENADVIDDFDPKMQISERTFYRDVIREHIDYAYLSENQSYPKVKAKLGRVDEIVSVMVDVVCSKREIIRVNSEELPQAIVKQRFLELDETHIDYVLTSLDNTTSEVRNIRAYLITALYNAPETIGSYYEAMVKHDLYGV